MSSEYVGLWVLGLAAAAILLLTIVSSVTITLLVVRRRQSEAVTGPNALQRWFSRHEGARSVVVIALTVLAFVPALIFRGLQAAGMSAAGWTRKKLPKAETPAARSGPSAYPTTPMVGLVEEPEARMHGSTPSHAPHELFGAGPVSVLSGRPAAQVDDTSEATERSRPVVMV